MAWDRHWKKLVKSVSAAFAVQKLGSYLADAVQSTGRLDKQLLVLRMALGKLKAAFGRAAAPIGEILIPALSKAVFAVIRAVKYVGQIITALLKGAAGMDSMRDSSKKAEVAIRGVGSALRRTVASFDELERLEGGSGSGGLDVGNVLQEQVAELDLWQKLIVSKIQSLLQPLRQIDFAPAVEAFGILKEAIKPFGQQLFAGLEWAWYNILVPIARWTVGDVLPAFLNLLSGAAEALDSVLLAARPQLNWLWQNFLLPLAQWTGGVILTALETFTQKLQNLSQWALANSEAVSKLTRVAATFLAIWAGGQVTAWLKEATGMSSFFLGTIQTVLTLSNLVQQLGQRLAALPEAIQTGWGVVRQTLHNGYTWLRESFLNPVAAGVRGAVNGIIGFLNALLQATVRSFNTMVRGINSLKFTVPDWVPGIGGRRLGFSLGSLSAPQIPYLAKGAVLPANRPFMAVVGDQRHGTNVEAPLTVIQEAVAAVLSDQLSGMMAGFSEVVRAIEEKEGSIIIGDDVIYDAAQRYGRKLAVAKGGL